MSPHRHLSRYISLSASLVGAVFNFALAVRLLALWPSLRWEADSEWEGSLNAWRIDPLKLIWGLLSAYFAAAAVTSSLGFWGIVRNRLILVRFFRDYSTADFVFTALSAISISYAAFTAPYFRASMCDILSRQPELMRELVDTGISLETCEYWFEGGIVVLLGLLFVLIAIRLHFVIVLAMYYNHLSHFSRERSPNSKGHHRTTASRAVSLQRIYLLPTSPRSSLGNTGDGVLVFAPIPVGSISEQDARNMNVTEAWVPKSQSQSASSRARRNSNSHPHLYSHTHCPSHRRNLSQHRSDPVQPPLEEKDLLDLTV